MNRAEELRAFAKELDITWTAEALRLICKKRAFPMADDYNSKIARELGIKSASRVDFTAFHEDLFDILNNKKDKYGFDELNTLARGPEREKKSIVTE